MTLQLAREQIVLVCFSRVLLGALAGELPPDSVVVIEEPEVAARREPGFESEYPAVARVVPWAYQKPGAMAALLGEEPSLKGARAVLPGNEYAVTAAADLAALLGLPGAGGRAGAVFRDKARQRRTAAAAGLGNPAYEVVDGAPAAVDFLRRTGGRCIVKPSAFQGSLGVRFVATPDEVTAAVARARHMPPWMLVPKRGIAADVLIEAVVEGPEFSVEMLLHHGTPRFSNVTRKQVAHGVFPVEVGHAVPGLPAGDERAAALIDATARLAAASGFGDGILHGEWIMGEGGPVLVECAARIPGDEITTLISLAYGFPLIPAYLRILLGEAPELPENARSVAAVRWLTAPEGRVEDVSGVLEAGRLPGVVAAKVTVGPGDRVRPLTSTWDRVGHVIAQGATAEEAEACAGAAADAIRIRTGWSPA